MLDATMEKYKKARELIAGGTPIIEAMKEVSMSPDSYYRCKRAESAVKRKKPRKSSGPLSQGFVDVPLKAPANNIAVVFCSAENLKDVLRGLQ